MDKENILYYQSNIKTSRNEDSVYAMKYANQQMLIDKLEQQCKKQKEAIDKAIEYIKEKARNNCWIDQYESCDLIKILKEVE